MTRTIALDFDGTIHPYTDGWQGPVPTDEPPIKGAVEFIYNVTDAGYRVVIFSCRADSPEGMHGIIAWLNRYGLGDLIYDVTHVKPPAVAYVDDRAVVANGNWGEVRDSIDRLAGEADARLVDVPPVETFRLPADDVLIIRGDHDTETLTQFVTALADHGHHGLLVNLRPGESIESIPADELRAALARHDAAEARP